MKRLLPLLCCLLVAASAAFATDQLRNVQTELKNEGFFYGELDGKPSAELNAAIRRYQIRNGLEVTGELNDATLKALGLSSGEEERALKDPNQVVPKSPPKPDKPVQSAPPPAAKPPVHLRRDDSVKESDKRALEEAERGESQRPQDRAIIRPPTPLDEPTDGAPSEDYVDMFADTPYETAPRSIQEETVRRAQTLLASRGFYRDDVDGDPGPAMEEALLTFQRRYRLPLTGRLDLQTLSVLRLLPSRGTGTRRVQPYNADPDRTPRQQVYRGVWVQ